jgi:histidinol phosphatase-like enzyme
MPVSLTSEDCLMTNHVHLLITPHAEDGLSKAMQMLGRCYVQYFNFTYHPERGVGDHKKDSFDRKPNPGMLLRAAKKHGLDLGRSIMIGDKDLDMQAASKAGVGVRCHYLAGDDGEIVSDVATHKIHSLREGISLLSESVATPKDA